MTQPLDAPVAATFQVITKSGQNDFHGALYEYFRNDALNANDPFLKASAVGGRS